MRLLSFLVFHNSQHFVFPNENKFVKSVEIENLGERRSYYSVAISIKIRNLYKSGGKCVNWVC